MPVCIGEVRVHLQGDFEGLERLFEFTEFRVQAAQLCPGFDVVVVAFDGRVVAFQGGSGVFAAKECFGEVEVSVCFVGAFHQAHPKRLDRFLGQVVLEQLPSLVEPVPEPPGLVGSFGGPGGDG